MAIVEDYNVLSQFDFLSDHRFVRCKTQIPRRAKFKGHCRSRGNMETVIPRHATETAKNFIQNRLLTVSKEKQSDPVQVLYDQLANAIKDTVKERWQNKKWGCY